mmetsp:Transcript_19228/g.67890  ORF Transcript_19228/g.67890 Transcript_19228/m.67890 type:complete len:894 (-) Transcript_19228:140-2821(-)|eukprot:CAMPEP_0203823528 /NCGR_PEP_ID=MMETSP0115-20131106/49423_1 /ASSEMBLY_ACC=CAM_ASM_000227 /TAXON_ID=33651 /ORGANISM="Bicosoecid sp, Strain ms1" /LENGTH=893 /DNA_ID=CAMNT_0050732565 /DNA_START=304 /DNA_END=2985 /DNA_ORIENTATION=+
MAAAGVKSKGKSKSSERPYDYTLPPTRIEEWRSFPLDERLTALPPMRESMAAALCEGRVWVVGGIGCGGIAGGRQSAVAAFDPKSNTWEMIRSQAGAAPEGRDRHSVVAVGRKLYLFGGEADYRGRVKGEHAIARSRRIFGDMWSFDTKTRVWERLAPAKMQPGPRRGHTMVLSTSAGGAEPKLVMFGGVGPDAEGQDTLLNEVWVFDIGTRLWSRPGNARPIQPRSSHSAVVVGDYMWVYGGMGKACVLNDLWTLNLRNTSWTCIPLNGDTPGPLYGHAVAFNPWYPSKFYLFGGRTYEYEPTDDLWSFDCKKKAFACVNDRGRAPSARYGHVMVTLVQSPELEAVLEAVGSHSVTTLHRRRSRVSHAGSTSAPPIGRKASLSRVKTKAKVKAPVEVEEGDPDAIARAKEERLYRKILIFGGVDIGGDGDHGELGHDDVHDVDEFHDGHVDDAGAGGGASSGAGGHGFCDVRSTHMIYCAPPPRQEKQATGAMARSAQNDRSRLLTLTSPLMNAHGTKKMSHTRPSRRMLGKPKEDALPPWHTSLPDVPTSYAEFKLIAAAQLEKKKAQKKVKSLFTGKSKLQRVVRMKTYKALSPAANAPRLDGRISPMARIRTAPAGKSRTPADAALEDPILHKRPIASAVPKGIPSTAPGLGSEEPYESEYKKMARQAHARMLESLGIADSPLRDQLFIEVPPNAPAMAMGADGLNGGPSVASVASASSAGLGAPTGGYRPLVTSTGLPLDVTGRTPGQQPAIRTVPKCDMRGLKRAFAQTPPPMRFRKEGRVHRIELPSPPPEGTIIKPWHRPRSGLVGAGAPVHSPITKVPVARAGPASPASPGLATSSLRGATRASGSPGSGGGGHVMFAADTRGGVGAGDDVPFGGVPSRPGTVQ